MKVKNIVKENIQLFILLFFSIIGYWVGFIRFRQNRYILPISAIVLGLTLLLICRKISLKKNISLGIIIFAIFMILVSCWIIFGILMIEFQ